MKNLFKKIYIFGHKNPDTDSVASSISLSYLKNKLGYSSEPKILGKLNNETKFILKKFNIPSPDIIESIDDNINVILVDHNELSQSLDGLNKDKIVEIIDHHKVNISLNNPINIITISTGSTCTIISMLYHYYNINIPKNICWLLLCGIISDTLLLKSPTSTDLDSKEVKFIQEKLKITNKDIYNFSMEMFNEGSNIDNYSLEDLINSDFKELEINNKKVGISQILTTNVSSIINYKKDFINYITKDKIKNKYYLYFIVITDIINEGSYIFFDNDKKVIFDKIFELNCNQGIFIKGLVSRKKQIIPKLSQII